MLGKCDLLGSESALRSILKGNVSFAEKLDRVMSLLSVVAKFVTPRS